MLNRAYYFLKLLATIVGVGFFYNTPVFAIDHDLGPWSVLLYGGGTAKQVFGQVIRGQYSSFGESIYTAEVAYTLDKKNIIRRIFEHVYIDTVQVASNFTYRHDYVRHDDVKEGNLYLIWRWTKFPWERYLSNSLAIGDGISYDSHPTFADRDNGTGFYPSDTTSRLLNYLMLEATFALPSKPQLQLVFRIHHRCTAWGTFPKRANAGSTSVGLGLRYYF